MAAKKKYKARASLLGSNLRTLQPKLRMIANGDATVNAVRAEFSAAVKVINPTILRSVDQLRGQGRAALSKDGFRAQFKRKTREVVHQKLLSRDVKVNVFIHTTTPDPLSPGVAKETGRRGRIAKATVAIDDLPGLASQESVRFVELGEPLKTPQPIVSNAAVKAPPLPRVKTTTSARHKNGKGVIIGIIDVQGFDFAHPDFLDSKGNTRFLTIWDQGGDARNPPKSPQFSYGAEFDQKVMNAAIRGAKKARVPATELERQSQRDPESHGTHVASIAAGNRGVCPNADIAAVLIDIPPEDMDRRRSFYDSTRLADAIDYLVAFANGRPISINVSLGTNGHAHDTSSAINRWIDSVVNQPGVSVTVAAGNSGQARADTEDPNDFGWLMGQIHASGQIPKAGLNVELEWNVVGNGLVDISENELELWYGPQDRFTVQVRPPGPDMEWTEEIAPGEYVENRELPDGSFLSIYNDLYHPANGANTISIYLSPRLSPPAVIGVRAGTWLVRIRGREVRDGSFHAWIERDDPHEIGPLGPKSMWRFPSYFSDRSNVDEASVSSLACGERIVSVANLDEIRRRINISSSQGPTRDGRFKPDVAAPGTDIVAAKGFAGANDLWVSMTGTSMACPFVTGVVGLMLAAQPRLTAAQIRGILLRTSRPLAGSDYNWRKDAGFGVVEADEAIKEALAINKPVDRTEP